MALLDPARYRRHGGDSPFQNTKESFNTNHLFGKSFSPHSVSKQFFLYDFRIGLFATLFCKGSRFSALWTLRGVLKPVGVR